MAKKISKKSMLPSPKDRKSKTIKKEEKPKRRPPRKPNTKIFDFILIYRVIPSISPYNF